jgi:hypothetical protein
MRRSRRDRALGERRVARVASSNRRTVWPPGACRVRRARIAQIGLEFDRLGRFLQLPLRDRLSVAHCASPTRPRATTKPCSRNSATCARIDSDCNGDDMGCQTLIV